jgi:hypothetical protein
MIRHIVLWTFLDQADGNTKSDNLVEAKRRLEALPAAIREITSFEVGIDIGKGQGASDLALDSTFDSLQTLKAYQEHPAHVEVVKFLRAVQKSKTVVDFEIPA